MTEDAVWNRLAHLKGDPAVQLAPRTRRVYGRLWKMFERFAAEFGYQTLPATPAVVAHYFMWEADRGSKPNTLRSARNAISSRHKLAGFESPTTDPRVTETLATLALRHQRTASESKQAAPIRKEHLRKLARKYGPDDLLNGRVTLAQYRRYVRDRAMVFTMYSGLLRAAEAAALRWSDIRPQEDGKALLTIRRSKTSATPETVCLTSRAAIYLQLLRNQTSPEDVEADSRIFGCRSHSAVFHRIRRAMAGIRDGASGHSCRVGAAQDLTMAGVPLQAVQRMGRWKTLDMPAHYASRVDPKRGAVNTLEDLLG